MTVTVAPVVVEVEAARTEPLDCSIVIGDTDVVVQYDGDDILTARHEGGYIGGVEWHLPEGVDLPSSARSTLIGRLMQRVLEAAAREPT